MGKSGYYEKCFSIDLRCFDCTSPDYGVKEYFEKLGCIPDKLFNHETYVDQLHTHTGVIDDTPLEPQWITQRAIPGGRQWTRYQLKELIDIIHQYGVKIYQGAEAAWNYWPEYGEINRCDYTYDNFAELFVVHADGRTSQEERGCINPLKHCKDGTLYEDILIRDLTGFLNDYGFDGFFAADGFAGLDCPLSEGDFSEDMTDQFGKFLGRDIPELSVSARARFILENCRYEWSLFYAERWAQFYRKLTDALYNDDKDLVIFTPWTMGPADSLFTYGIDYGLLYKAGVRTMCLEVMEEVIGRRWHNRNAWEITGVTAAVTAKLQAPGIKILWTAATANVPEHWHTLRDLPNILEREALVLGSTGVIDDDGARRKAFDGFLTIFGIDLTKEEWGWFLKRTEMGFGFGEKGNLGLTILWSDAILHEHAKRGQVWDLKTAVAQLQFSGIPVQSGCTIKGACKMNTDLPYLLVDPVGITDEEIETLKQVILSGRRLLVMGHVEHPGLLKMLGIRPADGEGEGEWYLADGIYLWKRGLPADCGRYQREKTPWMATAGAEAMIADGGNVLVCRTSHTLYCAAVRSWLPDYSLPMTEAEINCNRPVFSRQEDSCNSLRECAEHLAQIQPSELELAVSRCIYEFIPELPRMDKGQYYGLRMSSREDVLLFENPCLPAYYVAEVKFPHPVVFMNELPVRRLGPLGYRYWFDSKSAAFITVPPETCVPCKVLYSLPK